MRGTGKSVIGKNLAKLLNWEFIDTDKLIEDSENKKIADIIKEHGWKYFRNLEKQTAQSLSKKKRVVISTGGGFFLNSLNTKLMCKIGTVILLECNEEIMAKRIADDINRPKLSKEKHLVDELKKVWKQRKNIYYNACDISINTSEQTTVAEKDLNKKTEQILETLTTYKLIKR
jgi:shikimate kinase